MDKDTPIQKDILIYILRDQRRGERGTAQVSTQVLAEKLERDHGHLSLMQVRTSLSYLIDKGLVHFQQQMGGFQIVLCSLTPKGLEFLVDLGVAVDSLPDEADETASPSSVAPPAGVGLLEAIQRGSHTVGEAGARLLAVAQDVENAEITEGDREEALSALDLLLEQAAAPPGPAPEAACD